jgi:hypothetical protein
LSKYKEYEKLKKELQDKNLTSKEYEIEIKKIITRLKV